MFSFSDVFESAIWREVGNVLSFVMIGGIGYLIPQISKKIKTTLKRRFFNISLKKSMEIKIKLAELKVMLKANRIYLYQFHNGTVFLGDHSFHKYHVSAIFEVVAQNLSREIQNMQSIPMSKYAELLTYMIDNEQDIVVIGDHRGADMNFDEVDLEDIKYSMNPTTIAFIKVTTAKGEFIGLIAVHFDRELIKSKLLAEMQESTELNSLLIDIRQKI